MYWQHTGLCHVHKLHAISYDTVLSFREMALYITATWTWNVLIVAVVVFAVAVGFAFRPVIWNLQLLCKYV